YELLTGDVPFSGENFVAVAMKHINDVPTPVSAIRPDVAPRLDAAVMRALAKRPEDRFATMEEFGRELEGCLRELGEPGGSETVVLRPPRRAAPHRARRRVPVAALLVAVGLVAAVAALTVALVREDGGGSSGGSSGGGGGALIALRGVGAYDPPPGDGEE